MAKPNYAFEKRQKEIARKKKKEEKRQQKTTEELQRHETQSATAGDDPAPSSTQD